VARCDELELMPQRGADSQPFQIPVRHLPIRPQGALGAVARFEIAVLTDHQHDPLIERPRRLVTAGGFPFGELPENPRIGKRAAANGDAVTAGLTQHGRGVSDMTDVTIANDRDVIDRFHNAANPVAVDRAAEALRTRSPVNCNSRDADLLKLTGEP